MAYETITHTCGHTRDHHIINGSTERPYLTALDCPRCIKAERVAALDAALRDLPPLTGSEKQIKWANDLRPRMITDAVEDTLKRLDDVVTILQMKSNANLLGPISPEDHAKLMALWSETERLCQAGLREYIEQTSASWWIDHQLDHPREILFAFIAERKKEERH